MRLGITPETMGVPVVAIGVPTVIHAVTLVSDGMEMISHPVITRHLPLLPGLSLYPGRMLLLPLIFIRHCLIPLTFE